MSVCDGISNGHFNWDRDDQEGLTISLKNVELNHSCRTVAANLRKIKESPLESESDSHGRMLILVKLMTMLTISIFWHLVAYPPKRGPYKKLFHEPHLADLRFWVKQLYSQLKKRGSR